MDSSYPISIERLNVKGRGIGAFQRTPAAPFSQVEVISGLPGDQLLVEIGSKRKGRYQGYLKDILHSSPLRTVPRCPHVPSCGGCSLQQMRYEEQLKHKQSVVEKAFPLCLAELRPIIPCRDPWAYRNKMEFSFSQNRAGEPFLGLVIAGSKGRVLNLSECHLVSPWFIALLDEVRKWWKASGLHAYRLDDTGSLRTLTLREGKYTGDQMVILTVSGNPTYALKQAQLKSFIAAVQSVIGGPRVSIFLRIQQAQRGAPTQFYEMHLSGPDHIKEKLNIETARNSVQLQFKISPTSFFQPNSEQAQILYSQALKMVSCANKNVLDLYAGTATFAMAIALEAKWVTAIELNPHAVFDAESNREVNGIKNLDIICGDVGKKLKELFVDREPPDLVILDPPRAGLDSVALAQLKQLNPREILYVSCNPLTQSANIQELFSVGYSVIALQPVDQFPHTVHIENIALLRRSV